LQSLGDGMLDAALLARYEDVARPEALKWADWRAGQIDKINTSLQALEVAPQTLANRLDIGSLTIGCALWYVDLRFPELNWRERHPHVAAWYAIYSQRPAMLANWALPA